MNLTVNDRNQYERASYGNGERLRTLGPGGTRALQAYTLVAVTVLGGLTYLATQVYHGWDHAVVIGVGLITFYGLCRWVWPGRTRIY